MRGKPAGGSHVLCLAFGGGELPVVPKEDRRSDAWVGGSGLSVN